MMGTSYWKGKREKVKGFQLRWKGKSKKIKGRRRLKSFAFCLFSFTFVTGSFCLFPLLGDLAVSRIARDLPGDLPGRRPVVGALVVRPQRGHVHRLVVFA